MFNIVTQSFKPPYWCKPNMYFESSFSFGSTSPEIVGVITIPPLLWYLLKIWRECELMTVEGSTENDGV